MHKTGFNIQRSRERGGHDGGISGSGNEDVGVGAGDERDARGQAGGCSGSHGVGAGASGIVVVVVLRVAVAVVVAVGETKGSECCNEEDLLGELHICWLEALGLECCMEVIESVVRM